MFLIDIHYKKQLYIKHPRSTEWMFDTIKARLKQLKVNEMVFANDRIDFKVSSFNGPGPNDLMGSIGKGYFEYNKVTSIITYNISTLTNFIGACIASSLLSSIAFILASLGSFSIYLWLFYFSWLYGGNRISAFFEHRQFFNKLTEEIETGNYDVTYSDF